MKTTMFIGAVLAASQCVPEPSDPKGSETASPPNSTPDAGVTDASVDEDASPADTGTEVAKETANRLLQPGPAPFTVPTVRISWPQQKAMIRVPQGTRVNGDGDRATVILGEGYNFAYHVAPTGQAELPVPGDTATVQTRGDGTQMWYRDGHWYFGGTFGGFDCWNEPQSRHDREEVAMMIASCGSIEQGARSQ